MNSNEHVYLLYTFRIQLEKIAKFQAWAEERGMKFWSGRDGIVSYQTFRPVDAGPLYRHLGGRRAEIHGWSLVEAENQDALQVIMETEDFRRIQQEFLQFVESGSATHLVCQCVFRQAAELPLV